MMLRRAAVIFVLNLVLHNVECFVTLQKTQQPNQFKRRRRIFTESSNVAVFGVRNLLRDRFSSKPVPSKSSVTPSPSLHPLEQSNSLNSPLKKLTQYSSPTQIPVSSNTVYESASCNTATATVLDTATITASTNHINNVSLYSLAPIDQNRELSKLELEFRNMLSHFANYTERDIQSLCDPRIRAVFEGVSSSATDAAVYRAFEVLFEDIYPLRVAGRFKFHNLKQLMDTSQLKRQEDVDVVVNRTGLEIADVEEARLAFVSLAAQMNGDAFLTLEQIKQTQVTYAAQEILGFDTVDDFLDELVQHPKSSALTFSASHRLTFVDLMTGLQHCAEQICALDRCNPAAVMHMIVTELKETPVIYTNKLDDKRQKHSDRYDEMVATFRNWEDLVPHDKTGRIMDVVKGCFVGAQNQKVVNALRIVYVDYGPLRMAGDIIFKLVSSVMKGRERNRAKALKP